MRITMTVRRSPRLSFVAALTAFAIACGGGGSEPTSTENPPDNDPPSNPAPPTTPSSTANVAASSTGDEYGGRSRSFVPSSVSVTIGGTVTFTNPTDETHNITFTGAPASATLAPGQSHQESFPATGSFPFACTLHAGMNGTVTVVE